VAAAHAGLRRRVVVRRLLGRELRRGCEAGQRRPQRTERHDAGAVQQIAPCDGGEHSQLAIAARLVFTPICAGISIVGHLSRYSSPAA